MLCVDEFATDLFAADSVDTMYQRYGGDRATDVEGMEMRTFSDLHASVDAECNSVLGKQGNDPTVSSIQVRAS
jgi:hypothetical protein